MSKMKSEHEAIEEELGTMKTVSLRLTKEQWIRLHTETMGSDRSVEDVVEAALRYYEKQGGFGG